MCQGPTCGRVWALGLTKSALKQCMHDVKRVKTLSAQEKNIESTATQQLQCLSTDWLSTSQNDRGEKESFSTLLE